LSIRVERAGPGDPKLGIRIEQAVPDAAPGQRRRALVVRLIVSAVAGLAVAAALTAYAGTARTDALAGRGGVTAALASGFTGTFLMVAVLTFTVWTVAAWRRRTKVSR
jgi:hypothetical protein